MGRAWAGGGQGAGQGAGQGVGRPLFRSCWSGTPWGWFSVSSWVPCHLVKQEGGQRVSVASGRRSAGQPAEPLCQRGGSGLCPGACGGRVAPTSPLSRWGLRPCVLVTRQVLSGGAGCGHSTPASLLLVACSLFTVLGPSSSPGWGSPGCDSVLGEGRAGPLADAGCRGLLWLLGVLGGLQAAPPVWPGLVRAGESGGVESGPAPWGPGWLPRSAPGVGKSRSWACVPPSALHVGAPQLPARPEASPAVPGDSPAARRPGSRLSSARGFLCDLGRVPEAAAASPVG